MASEVMFYCPDCSVGASSYKMWLIHLTTERHQTFLQQNQDLVELKLTHPANRDKSIVVNRIELNTPLLDIATYFSRWGLLRDFIYRGGEEEPIQSHRPNGFGGDDYLTKGFPENGGFGDNYNGYPESDYLANGYDVNGYPANGHPENGYDDFGHKVNGPHEEPQRTMHCVLLYEEEDAVLEATRTMEHSIKGSTIYVQKLYNDTAVPADMKEVQILVQNNHQRGFDFGLLEEIRPEPVDPVVKMDLTEFETDRKKKVFENANEYKKIALQIKEDLADLKLEDQVEGFCKLLCLTPEQLQRRVDMGDKLLGILQPSFPDCSIYPFGLDYIGVSTDIDTANIVVDPFGKMTNDCGAIHTIVPDCQTSLIVQVFDLLKQEQYKLRFCRDVQLQFIKWVFSPSKKVQRISFIHRGSGVLVNLFIENFLIVQESRLFRFLSSLDPRVHPLLCFTRLFGSVYKTLQPPDECFQSQIMSLLLMYFLASKQVLPTIHKLCSLSTAPLIVDNTDISFCNDKGIINHPKAPFMDDLSIRSLSTLSLLQEFFESMAKMDLARNVVCPLLGRLVPVTDFGRTIGPDFPAEMRKRYLFNMDGSERTRRLFIGSPVCLQDPLDLTTNLTENLTFEEVSIFKDLCSRAGKFLKGILESGAGDVVDIFTDLFRNLGIELGDKTFLPMISQSQSSESEDEESVVEESMEVPESESDSDYDLDYEKDEDDEDTTQEIKKGRIKMSQSLREFFEKAVDQAMPREDEKLPSLDIRRKFQVLWLQYIIEFNSRFWSHCLGFTVEMAAYQKPEYSQTGKLLASLSLNEIFDLIQTEEYGYGTDFRCEMVGSMNDILYKKTVWRKKYLRSQKRPLYILLTDEFIPAAKNQEKVTRKMVRIPFEKRLEFSGKLEVEFDMREEIPKDGSLKTMAKLTLRDECYGRGKSNRAAKLRFLIGAYETLARKYINLRVKQWLGYACKELEYPKFDREFKKMQKKRKGHPKWKKFRQKWKLLGRC